jgi:hypothetical protein
LQASITPEGSFSQTASGSVWNSVSNRARSSASAAVLRLTAARIDCSHVSRISSTPAATSRTYPA